MTREDHQVGPRNFVAVLLFDWPKKSACLVEVAVVWPRVGWCETLHTCAAAATTV